MNTQFNLLIILFFVGSHYILAMESIITSEQKMVMVQCCSKNCETHLLERWKIFESIPFHMYCLKNNYLQQKDVTIKLPSTTNISCEKMNLFSEALDHALLSKVSDVKSKKLDSKELFKKYFEALKLQQQRLLIITAGRLDENHIKQLHSPMLCALLVDVYFQEKEFLNNNIKSLIHENKLGQEECYISKMIKYNLERFNFNDITLRNYAVHTNARGYINNVPSRLAVKGAVINDQGSYFIAQKCIDKINRDVFRWKELEDWQYGVQYMDEGQAEKNKVLLWSINKNKEKTTCMAIEHPKNIRQETNDNRIIRCFFSRNSEYLITNTTNSIYATKITPQENGLSVFKTYQIAYDDRIMAACFNSDDTRLIVSSFDKDGQGKLRLFNISGECIKSITIDVVPYFFFNFNGKKAEVFFSVKLEGEKIIKYSCIFINDNLEICAKKDCTSLLEEVIRSPDNNYWATLTNNGCVTLICTKAEFQPLFYDISTKKSNLVNTNKKKLLFSSDSKSLIVLGLYKNYKYSDQPLEYIIDVWSTITGEKRASTTILLSDIEETINDLNINYSFGLTPRDEDLVLYAENSKLGKYYRIFRKTFLFKEDQEDVNFFLNTAPVSVLAILRRLYVAQQNNDKVIFYEEEPAYKILQALNKSNFIRKCLHFSVTDNKKDIFSLLSSKGSQLVSKAEEWYASIKFTKNA